MKIKGRILTSMLSLALLIIIASSSLNYFFTLKKYETELDNRKSLETLHISEGVNKWMSEEVVSLNNIKDTVTHLNLLSDRRTANSYLKRMTAESDYVAGYYAQVESKEGNYLLSSYNKNTSSDLTDREWYKEGLKAEDYYITDPYIDPDSQENIITISKSFKTKKGEIGVFGADILISDLVRLVDGLNLEQGSQGFLITKEGDGIAYQNKGLESDGELVNLFDVYGSKLKNIMDNQNIRLKDREIKSTDGIYKYFYLSEIQGADWYFGTATENGVINQVLDQITIFTLIFTVVLLILVVVISVLVADSIAKPIVSAVGILKRIGDLDLTVETSEKYRDRKDEIGDMSRTFTIIIDKLRVFMFGMRDSIDVNNNVYVETVGNIQTLNRQSEENAATTEELSAGMEETTATTENIFNSVENIDKSINNFSKLMDTIDNIAKKIQKESEDSNEEFTKSRDITIEKYTVAKENIEEAIESARSVERIGILSESITKIAEQTTLLSLNAAIEAARAGESGKGFEVVAVEIRKLAEDSNEAARQIKDITGTIEGSIGKLVYDTEDLINLIEGTVMEDYNGFVDSSEGLKKNGLTLDKAVDEIVRRSASINEDVGSITKSIEEITMTMEESTKATITIAEENMRMVESIQNIGVQMETSKESGDRLEELISEVNLNQLDRQEFNYCQIDEDLFEDMDFEDEEMEQ